MYVTIDGWAWMDKENFTPDRLAALKAKLTIYPTKVGDHPGETPGPVKLFTETEQQIGIARQYFVTNQTQKHEVIRNVTQGNTNLWAGPIKFAGTLREEQALATYSVSKQLRAGSFGGIIRAVPGWGKTVCACALIAEMNVPTLVIVHKEFLVDQWMQRILGDKNQGIPAFLPDAKVGLVKQDECDYQGKNVVIAMVHSLAARDYGHEFYHWPGLIIVDECHRIGAATWAPVPAKFPAAWRIGFSATPRRKDGADDVFFHHIGPLLFAGKEKRLLPKVRRVITPFKLVKTPRFNPNLAPKSLLLKFMCGSNYRNKVIIEQVQLALRAGRKCLILSERLAHLQSLEISLLSMWQEEWGPKPTTGSYVGGMSKEDLAVSARAQCIFATTQFVSEGLDIPSLDTLFLTVPMTDVEQAVGRILRPHEGKKEPVVVDFRDPEVPLCEKAAAYRDRYYEKLTG